jgi:hypothetical protein
MSSNWSESQSEVHEGISAMQNRRVSILFRFFFVAILAFAGARSVAQTASFTLAAENAAMPTRGTGSIQWTLTSVNGYEGLITVDCAPSNPPKGANLPWCEGPVNPPPFGLTANETLSETFLLSATPGSGVQSFLHRAPQGGAGSLALAGVLLFGAGFRRRVARWVRLTLLAGCALTGLVSTSACGGYSNTLTPGTYTYAITAWDLNTNVSASTTANVTVPPGIPAVF